MLPLRLSLVRQGLLAVTLNPLGVLLVIPWLSLFLPPYTFFKYHLSVASDAVGATCKGGFANPLHYIKSWPHLSILLISQPLPACRHTIFA
ncbi:hypothetical protein BJX68DRAFT_72488 [Aspergillus pseudodeflectus]|uniref:Uncharacterized protein n=1 Tax=Aspergillus pseudodeflectus TaxID=176178 RepID=A0ABR4KEV2_9EURO